MMTSPVNATEKEEEEIIDQGMMMISKISDENQKITQPVFVSRRPIRRATAAPITSTPIYQRFHQFRKKVKGDASEIGMKSQK